jgi:hypothetical protein
MKINSIYSMKKACALALVISALASCTEDLKEPAPLNEQDASTIARAVYDTRTINWDNRLNDTYTNAEAVEDFGNVLFGWQDSRAYNSGGTCRIKLLKDALAADCGIISKIDVADGSEYELQFDVKYHSEFDWSRGGKVGFGFAIGDAASGCNPGWDGTGGTFRVIWYQDDAGRVYFQPYVYYKDQPESCGNRFGKTYPATGSLARGQWYTVKLYAKSNTGTSTNGRIKMTVNGTIVLDQAIRWTTNDSKRLINGIYFSTFRGGSEAYWQSSTDGYIYFDNVSWKRLAN